MVSEPEFLRKAACKTVNTKDRHLLARVMVNSTHVRNFIYSIVRHDELDEAQTPDRTDLGAILRQVAKRIQDVDDPALKRLGGAKGNDEFQHALGKFLRDTVRQVMRPPTRPASISSTAEEIAAVLLAAGLDEDVIDHMAKIKTCTMSYLTAL
jgi:hypothetical protein